MLKLQHFGRANRDPDALKQRKLRNVIDPTWIQMLLAWPATKVPPDET